MNSGLIHCFFENGNMTRRCNYWEFACFWVVGKEAEWREWLKMTIQEISSNISFNRSNSVSINWWLFNGILRLLHKWRPPFFDEFLLYYSIDLLRIFLMSWRILFASISNSTNKFFFSGNVFEMRHSHIPFTEKKSSLKVAWLHWCSVYSFRFELKKWTKGTEGIHGVAWFWCWNFRQLPSTAKVLTFFEID